MDAIIYNQKTTKSGLFFNLPDPELIFKESQKISDAVFTYEISNFKVPLSEPELLFNDDYFASMAQL
ncbi:MAG: hypothetical protein M0P66_18780 [Salinivirgaceae bacterium]|nr:hypothetical protein [Salinivirgaceae bacterium]